MVFVNLNEMFLSTAGGTVNGDVKVEGAITVNNGVNGCDVAEEIGELKEVLDSVATMTEVNTTIQTAIGDAIAASY